MTTPGEMLDWSPDELREWLRSGPSMENFAWLTLGVGAAMEANSLGTGEQAKGDALAEVALYAFELAVRWNQATHHENLLSTLVLRSGLIAKFGEQPGSARDGDKLLAIISGEVAQAEHLREKIADGSDPIDIFTTPKSVLLVLRKVKGVFRAAELFLAAREADLPESVSWWWSRRARLP
ncbi:MAG: hypothetical protein HS111_11355 [Kofleriaceae bacterium]|nr:hypothetical protein [Kofleriaceae bacterium]MCL4229029.1 hypothetical protein [Myxococcales bacterium]